MWDAARSHFGSIDIWINNAGMAHPDLKFWELPQAEIDKTVSLNLIGLMYGCRVAINGMLAQGGGFIYNMYGFGSTGMMRPGLSIYGSTKRAVNYFTEAMVKELANTPVKMGSLSPGMVITDLVSEQYKDRPEEFEKAKQIFNLLGDRVENVTPHLVDQILANDKNGAALKHMSTPRMMSRMITRQAAQARSVCGIEPDYPWKGISCSLTSSSSNSTNAPRTTFRNCARSC